VTCTHLLSVSQHYLFLAIHTLLTGDRKLQEQPVFGEPAGVAEQGRIDQSAAVMVSISA
jgi:hypothetical protein